jgi:hypothetical protein
MKKNEMFETILKDTIGSGHNSYDKKDMQALYDIVVYECILFARKHVLEKFGIQEPFEGTTQIEKALAEHFEVE